MSFEKIGWLDAVGTFSDSVATADTHYDSDWVDFAITVAGRTIGYVQSVLDTAKAEAWFHVKFAFGNYPGSFASLKDDNIIEIYDDLGNLFVYVDCENGGSPVVKLNLGSSVETVATIAAAETHSSLDFHIISGSSGGRVAVYQDNVLLDTYTGDTIGDFSGRLISKFQGQGPYVNGSIGIGAGNGNGEYDMTFSEACWAYGGDSTLGCNFFNKGPTSAGAHTAWTGLVTDIDDQATLDGNVISAAAGALRETFIFPDLPTTSGQRIAAVAVQDWGATTGGPSDYEHSVRISATDYDQGALTVGAVLGMHETVMYQSPATVDAWEDTEFNNAEFGVESIA